MPTDWTQNWFGQPYAPPSYDLPPQSAQSAQDQLLWFASLNNPQNPQGWIDQQAQQQQQDRAFNDYWSQMNDPTGQGVARAMFNGQQSNDAAIRQLQQNAAQSNASIDANQRQLIGLGTQAQGMATGIQQANAPLIGRNWASVDSANAADQATLDAYRQGINQQTAFDWANYNNLANAANAPMQMTMSPYVGGASSSSADVSRQLSAYNQLQGIANGSLDQVSQAAQARANAVDIANQKRAAGTLEAAGNGSLDIDPDSIKGMKDMYGAWQGSQDVHVGQEDPDSYRNAVEARDKYKALSDPTVTAQERLMYELALQKQEQDERGVREALQADARQRGVSGYGAEIARSGIAAQQTSRNRMLADMAAGANAINRSQQAQAGWASTSLGLNDAANAIATNNAANRLTALANYTGIGAGIEQNNMNRRLTAQQAAYGAYSDLRAQGFNEEYARGVAADNMANANANRRLEGSVSAANQSNAIRSANDQMAQFNAVQRQNYQMESDKFAANRQDAQFGRQVAVAQQGNVLSGNFGQNNTNLANAGFGVNQTGFNRTQSGINTQMGIQNQNLGAQQWATGVQSDAAHQGITNASTKFNQSNVPISAQTQQNAINTQNAIQLHGIAQGKQESDRAWQQWNAQQGVGPLGYTPGQTTPYTPPEGWTNYRPTP